MASRRGRCTGRVSRPVARRPSSSSDEPAASPDGPPVAADLVDGHPAVGADGTPATASWADPPMATLAPADLTAARRRRGPAREVVRRALRPEATRYATVVLVVPPGPTTDQLVDAAVARAVRTLRRRIGPAQLPAHVQQAVRTEAPARRPVVPRAHPRPPNPPAPSRPPGAPAMIDPDPAIHDIGRQTFRLTRKGYDPEEVRAYLQRVDRVVAQLQVAAAERRVEAAEPAASAADAAEASVRAAALIHEAQVQVDEMLRDAEARVAAAGGDRWADLGEHVARILAHAEQEAVAIRSAAEASAAEERQAAEQDRVAAGTELDQARQHAAALVAAAEGEAAELRAGAEPRARAHVAELLAEGQAQVEAVTASLHQAHAQLEAIHLAVGRTLADRPPPPVVGDADAFVATPAAAPDASAEPDPDPDADPGSGSDLDPGSELDPDPGPDPDLASELDPGAEPAGPDVGPDELTVEPEPEPGLVAVADGERRLVDELGDRDAAGAERGPGEPAPAVAAPIPSEPAPGDPAAGTPPPSAPERPEGVDHELIARIAASTAARRTAPGSTVDSTATPGRASAPDAGTSSTPQADAAWAAFLDAGAAASADGRLALDGADPDPAPSDPVRTSVRAGRSGWAGRLRGNRG